MSTTDHAYFIGLDDTDYGDSIGTGAFVRELAIYLASQVGAEPRGVTRHQFLIHPDIPYTTHNSSACLEVTCPAGIDAVADSCRRFVKFLFHDGADPGLCIAHKSQLNDRLVAFGRRAQTEVVAKAEALELGRAAGILLEEHGGEGIGVIGALGGCSLRMDGDDGRFISLPGIRECVSEMTVSEIKAQTPVESIVDEDGRELDAAATIATNKWVRPELRQHRIVLRAKKNGQAGSYLIKKQSKGQK
jgi:hypothetical protein